MELLRRDRKRRETAGFRGSEFGIRGSGFVVISVKIRVNPWLKDPTHILRSEITTTKPPEQESSNKSRP